MDASQIALRLNAARIAKGVWQCDCPSCGYKDGFKITERDGRALMNCYVGCDARQAFVAATGVAGWEPQPERTEEQLRERRELREATRQKATAAALRLWREATLADATTLVPTYLASRAITIAAPVSIRYLPEALHTEAKRRLPCMIAAVTRWPEPKVIAVHRTYLAPDGSGKADVMPAKKTLGPIEGGAIRLASATGTLVLCEGIETGLSLQQDLQLPVWACISAGGLETVKIPPETKRVIVAADHDPRGIEAAENAARRLFALGHAVETMLPPAEGQDFNDVLKGARA